MKRVKEVKAGRFYIFKGLSNANSCFIETLEHGRLFLRYADYFLKNYVKVYDYIINEEGWMIVLKIQSKKELSELLDEEEFEVWRVISERMRLFLSTFVTISNRSKGRTGCLIHSSYERYYFESLSEALGTMEDIRNQRINLYQGNSKYRAFDKHYEVDRNLGKGSIFLCSQRLREQKEGSGILGEVFCLQGLTIMVLQKMIKSTFKNTVFTYVSP